MHTPTAALAWELWRRHRERLMIIAGIVLAFIFVYPWLCSCVCFNPASLNASDELGRAVASFQGHPTPINIAQVLFLLCLAVGPTLAMVLTLLYVTWMFTFTEINATTKDFLVFPSRLFTLPFSTSFLFGRLVIGGLATILGLYAIWVYCVQIPHMEILANYQNCFAWMTLLVLVQALAWALAAWPIIRTLALMTALLLFLSSPERHSIVESPVGLMSLFLLGVGLARIGLQKIRHGKWQAWAWSNPFANWAARAKLRGPKQFASQAQAQLWFEWRRSAAGKAFAYTAALALIPVIFLGLRAAAGFDSLTEEGMGLLTGYLLLLPPVLYFMFGASPICTDQPFLLIRPLTSGEMVLPMLKTAAIGSVLSWVAVLAALSVMPWLGNFHAIEQHISPLAGCRAAMVIGLIFLSWRCAVANLCFALTGNRRAGWVPGLALIALYVCVAAYFVLRQSGVRWEWLVNHVSELAACLVAVKFLLAFRSFHASVQRRLLAPSAVGRYLVVWSLLVAALLATMLLLARPDPALVLPASLGILLLVPLARIGFCPLALAHARHPLSISTTQ